MKMLVWSIAVLSAATTYASERHFEIVSRRFDHGPQKLGTFATGTLAAAPVSEKPQPADKSFLVDLRLELKPDQYTLPGEWAIVIFSTYECIYKKDTINDGTAWKLVTPKPPAPFTPQTRPTQQGAPGFELGSFSTSFRIQLDSARGKLGEAPFEIYITSNSATPDSHVVPPTGKTDLRLSGILHWKLDKDGKFVTRPQIDNLDCQQCILLVSSKPSYPAKRAE